MFVCAYSKPPGSLFVCQCVCVRLCAFVCVCVCVCVCVFVKIMLNTLLFVENQEATYFFQQTRDCRSQGVSFMESQEVISFYRLPI